MMPASWTVMVRSLLALSASCASAGCRCVQALALCLLRLCWLSLTQCYCSLFSGMLVPVDHESSRALRPRRRVPLDVQLGALFAAQQGPCLRQRMGSRAFIVQGCPCVPCRCRRSFTNNTNKSTVSQIIYSVPQMRFTWLAKPSRFHMVCETMKRFTWFVKPCEIRTIKPIKFHMDPTKPCEITDPYGSLRSDAPLLATCSIYLVLYF